MFDDDMSLTGQNTRNFLKSTNEKLHLLYQLELHCVPKNM